MAFYGTGFGVPAPTVVGGFPSYPSYPAPYGQIVGDASDAGSVASGSVSGAPVSGAPFQAFPTPCDFGACAPPAPCGPCAAPVFEQPCNTCPAVLPMHKPGYNERYIAWKNRQKAFNKYKKLTKQAIRDSQNLVPSYAAPVNYAPVTYGPTTVSYAPPTFVQPQFPLAAPMVSYPAAQSYSQAGDYSQAAEPVEEVAPEEPEIRGTQV